MTYVDNGGAGDSTYRGWRRHHPETCFQNRLKMSCLAIGIPNVVNLTPA